MNSRIREVEEAENQSVHGGIFKNKRLFQNAALRPMSLIGRQT
jgi:hypothetical protein